MRQTFPASRHSRRHPRFPQLALILFLLTPLLVVGCSSSGQRTAATAYTPEYIGARSATQTISYDPVQLAPVSDTWAAPQSQNPFPADAPAIRAASAIMIDGRTGNVLYSKNPDERRAVASTQKLITAMLVTERGRLDEYVTVQPVDTRVEPTKLNLKAGDRYTRRQLLTAIMVRSSNDAANVLARDHSGSVAAFAQAMTAKARQLGALNSQFRNPHGLTEPGQYSTARDMARVAIHAYRDPVLRRMMNMQSYVFNYADGRTAHLTATNHLLKRSSIYTGMKTGTTNASGRCLITSAELPGGLVILVQLGSANPLQFQNAEQLVEWQRGRSRRPVQYARQ